VWELVSRCWELVPSGRDLPPNRDGDWPAVLKSGPEPWSALSLGGEATASPSSIVLSTNKPFAEWPSVFPNAACVVTLVDDAVLAAMG
jgi:hypothetical protein